MPQAVFTQCTCVLFESAPDFARVRETLARFAIVGEKDEGEEEGGWALSGPSLLVSMEPECKGVLVIDVVPRAWPDDLGDGEAGSPLRIAVAMGHFGPHTVPHSLARASQQGVPIPPMDTSYYLGRERLVMANRAKMSRWRKRLFALMSRNARSATEFFQIPPNRVVELGAQIEF